MRYTIKINNEEKRDKNIEKFWIIVVLIVKIKREF
jgi:hypothetical protein